MDRGKSFLASIEEKGITGKYSSEFSETHKTIDECLEVLSGVYERLKH